MTRDNHRITRMTFAALLLLALAALPVSSFGQSLTPAFTYQGELRLNTGPATGDFDMEFRFYDAEASGSQIGPVVAKAAVFVVDGLFSVPLDFGGMQFAGDRQWLEVRIRESGGGAFETLSPRTEVTATPYAWVADSVLNDATGNDWRLTGNAGTNPASNFIGTIDNQPLVLKVADVQALRLEPSAETFGGLPITANVIAGSLANTVGAGVRGATIAGGGVPTGDSEPDQGSEAPNEVKDNYGTVGGGYGNVAGDSDGDASTKPFATVGGGFQNKASGLTSTVSGGQNNAATGSGSTVSGGDSNTATGTGSTVSGGSDNCAGANFSWTGGRRAKVRPGSETSSQSQACSDVPTTGFFGDGGTFVWADNQFADFVSSGQNQFLVRATGGVGLGTNAPAAQLHVTEAIDGSANNSADHVAIIENTFDAMTATNGPDVLALKTSAVNPTATSNLITFFDGNDTAIGSIQGDGSGGIVFNSGGADFAEWLPKRSPDASIQPGDVVGWHADGVSHETRGALRVMAVSTRPIVAGNAPPDADAGNWARIGFVGQVPVRVRGPVAAGDWILPSGHEDGTGVAASPLSLKPGDLQRVIGRALASADQAGIHSVNVVVGLGNPDAVGGTLARMKTDNGTLRSRIDALEATNVKMVAANSALKQQLAEVQEAQRSELALMRNELDRLHNMLAPRLAAQEP